jgi:hypothetical protein
VHTLVMHASQTSCILRCTGNTAAAQTSGILSTTDTGHAVASLQQYSIFILYAGPLAPTWQAMSIMIKTRNRSTISSPGTGKPISTQCMLRSAVHTAASYLERAVETLQAANLHTADQRLNMTHQRFTTTQRMLHCRIDLANLASV